MDDSSLLAGSSWPAGGDGGAKAEDEELQCTGFVNWGRAIDVTCGLLGALLLVYSASCAADPIADDYADSCPQGTSELRCPDVGVSPPTTTTAVVRGQP